MANEDRIQRAMLDQLKQMNAALAASGGTGGNQFNTRAQGKEKNHTSDKASEILAKAAVRQGSGMLAEVAKSQKSIKALTKAQEKLEKLTKADAQAVKNYISTIADVNNMTKKQRETIEEFGFSAADAAKMQTQSTEDIHKASKKQARTLHQITKYMKKEFEIAGEAAGGLGDGGGSGSGGGGKGAMDKIKGFASSALGGKIIAEGKAVIQNQFKYGVGASVEQGAQGALMGMNPSEMTEVLGTYRQTIEQMGMSTDEFARTMRERSVDLENGGMADGLALYAGSFKEAGLFVAKTAEQFAKLGGGSVGDMQGFMTEQEDMFKQLNRGISTTVEEFNALRDELVDSAEQRGILNRMDGKRRQQYAKEITLAYTALRYDGLTNEEAKEALRLQQKQKMMKAVDRLQQGAKVQMLAGAVGFDQGKAQELAAILKKGVRASPEEDARKAELQSELAVLTNEKQASGFSNEAMIDAVLAQLGDGVEELFGAASVLSIGARRNDIAPKDLDAEKAAAALAAANGENAPVVNSLQVGALATDKNTAATQALTLAMLGGAAAGEVGGTVAGAAALAAGGYSLKKLMGANEDSGKATKSDKKRQAKEKADKDSAKTKKKIEKDQAAAIKENEKRDKKKERGNMGKQLKNMGKSKIGMAIGLLGMGSAAIGMGDPSEMINEKLEGTAAGRIKDDMNNNAVANNAVMDVVGWIPGIGWAASAGTTIGSAINASVNETSPDLFSNLFDSMPDWLGGGKLKAAEDQLKADEERFKALVEEGRATRAAIEEGTAAQKGILEETKKTNQTLEEEAKMQLEATREATQQSSHDRRIIENGSRVRARYSAR